MNSNHSVWKVLVLVLAAILIVHCWPAVLGPLAFLGGIVLAIAGTLTGGLAALLGILLAILIPLALAAIAVIGVTSPLWLPVLAILALVSIGRRRRATLPGQPGVS